MRILKFSTRSCGQCKLVSRQFKLAGIEYEEVMCEDHPDMAEQYGISHVPVVVRLNHKDEETLRLNNLQSIFNAIKDGSLTE